MTGALFSSRQAEENNNQMRDDLGDKRTLIKSRDVSADHEEVACVHYTDRKRPAFSISHGKVAYLRLRSVNIQGN